jgi:hypothetical protein
MMGGTYYKEHKLETKGENLRNSRYSQQIRFTASSFLKFDNEGATWRIHSTYEVVYEIQPFTKVNQSHLLLDDDLRTS